MICAHTNRKNMFVINTLRLKQPLASLMLFLLFALLMPTNTVAQLKVSENTTFTVKHLLTSKEAVNAFDSDVLGEGEIYLAGEQQTLTTAPEIYLNTLRIQNADKLTVNSTLNLNGDLVVEQETLQLNHHVNIKGIIILQNKAAVKHLYSENNVADYKPIAINSNHTQLIQQNMLLLVSQFLQNDCLVTNKQQSCNIFAIGLWQSIAQQPIKPPPQWS